MPRYSLSGTTLFPTRHNVLSIALLFGHMIRQRKAYFRPRTFQSCTTYIPNPSTVIAYLVPRLVSNGAWVFVTSKSCQCDQIGRRAHCVNSVVGWWQQGVNLMGKRCLKCGKDDGGNVGALWQHCVAMVVTVWCCALCYHIQLTANAVKGSRDASTAPKW